MIIEFSLARLPALYNKAPPLKIGVDVVNWQVKKNSSSSSSSGAPHSGRILRAGRYSACGCASARGFICPPAEVHDGMTIVIVSATILSGIKLNEVARINVVANQPPDLVCVPIPDRIIRWPDGLHQTHRSTTCLT